MKTACFDAVVNFPSSKSKQSFPVVLEFVGRKTPALIIFYEKFSPEKHVEFFAQVYPHESLSLKWKDTFEVRKEKEGILLGKGIVLNPFSSKVRGKKLKKRIDFLLHLKGSEKDMILVLTQDKGVKGLGEDEIINFSHLSKKSLWNLCEEMEGEGKIRIISFSPFFLIFQQSLFFLQEKIVAYLEQFHKKHPGERGISQEIIKKRFHLHPKILALAIKHLVKQGKIKKSGEMITLSTFTIIPTPEEENILRSLEEMILKGEFRSVSLQDIQNRFHLSSKKLHTMLSILIESKNIVQGKEGFFLHSAWLDEIILKIRKYGKEELTVSDFKRVTGLTRKYAIPLLELLDQMGVTRRISSSRRQIL